MNQNKNEEDEFYRTNGMILLKITHKTTMPNLAYKINN